MKNKQRLRAGMATGLLAAAGLFAGLVEPAPAAAFCGFYVAGADTQLYANATMVVLMREGTKTVLSMQNNYEGPAEDFAMVIPVPTVLNEDQVKVLPAEVFQHVDALGAPRLVEYWEQDPCQPQGFPQASGFPSNLARADAAGAPEAADLGVTIEAQFAVGEYDVVILSAEDSTGLDTWLRGNDYNIPDGAEPVLASYIAEGTKFFVAKVDPKRVTFKGNQAVLSPLRFHYDSENFALPVRLGLLNSQGTQDLIVNILAQERYEAANYDNVTIPTNIRVHNEVRDSFGGFYESLFSEVLEKKPGAIVTEYSWTATTCDPCPTTPLSPEDLVLLGEDVITTSSADIVAGSPQTRPIFPQGSNMTLTRLHYRYTSDTLGEDLVFKQAEGIMGGRGMPDQKGKLPPIEPSESTFNNFQGRYVILHPWEDKITCDAPNRGFWGGPPGQPVPDPLAAGNQALSGAAPRAADLPLLVAESIPEIDIKPVVGLDPLEVRVGDLPERSAPEDESNNGDSGDDGESNSDDATGDDGENDVSAAADDMILDGMGGTQAPGSDGVANAAVDSDESAATASASNDNAAPTVTSDGCSCRVGSSGRPAPVTGLALLTGLFLLRKRRRTRR